jgi:hypothetical protein
VRSAGSGSGASTRRWMHRTIARIRDQLVIRLVGREVVGGRLPGDLVGPLGLGVHDHHRACAVHGAGQGDRAHHQTAELSLAAAADDEQLRIRAHRIRTSATGSP